MPPVTGVKSVNGKRAIFEGLTQETRKQRGGTLVPLKGFIITASTEDRHRKAAGQFFAYLRRQREVIPQTPELMDALVSQSVYLRAVGRRPFKKFSWGCSQQHAASPTILERAITCIMEVFQGLAAGRGSSQGTSPFITNFSYLKIQSLQDFRATFEKHKVSQKLHEIGTTFCETHQKHTTVSKTHDFA